MPGNFPGLGDRGPRMLGGKISPGGDNRRGSLLQWGIRLEGAYHHGPAFWFPLREVRLPSRGLRRWGRGLPGRHPDHGLPGLPSGGGHGGRGISSWFSRQRYRLRALPPVPGQAGDSLGVGPALSEMWGEDGEDENRKGCFLGLIKSCCPELNLGSRGEGRTKRLAGWRGRRPAPTIYAWFTGEAKAQSDCA